MPLPEIIPIRAFIAVPVSDEVREAVGDLQQTLKRTGMNMRWVPPGNIHYTLKFLGDIDPAIVDPLGEQLRGVAAQNAPFNLAVGGLGAFPKMREARVFWVGLQAGTDSMQSLAREVSAIVKKFPTQADNKPFKPHLTLARARDRRPGPLKIPEKLMNARLGEYTCDRLLLIRSQLAPGGAQYTTLVDAPMVG